MTAGTEGGRYQVKQWRIDKPVRTEARSAHVDQADDDDVEFEPLVAQQSSTFLPVEDRGQWALATIVNINSESVTCEVNANGPRWELSLPRVLFSSDIRFGLPVRIGVRIIDGYRTPVVEAVEIGRADDPEIEELRAQLRAL